MDFIFNLLKTKDNKKAILVVVDKLTKKSAFYRFTWGTQSRRYSKGFLCRSIQTPCLPRKIISDRDTRFTAAFWKELMKVLKIRSNVSTAFHPRTDGQSEQSFRTLQEILRCFVSFTQRDWSRYLPGLEFAFNKHINDTTKYSPFYLEYGPDPLLVSYILFSDESSSRKTQTNS